jgi:hypothetical protein
MKAKDTTPLDAATKQRSEGCDREHQSLYDDDL